MDSGLRNPVRRLAVTIAPVLALALAAAPASADFLQYCRADQPHTLTPFAQQNESAPGLRYQLVEVDGLRILEGAGEVTEQSGDILRAAIRANSPIDEVWLTSPGGNVDGGLAMGRALREYGLFVRVPKGHYCASSCSLAFLGGALRSVQGDYGIHMFSRYYTKGNAHFRMVAILKSVEAARKTAGPEAADKKLIEALQQDEQLNAITAAKLARYLVEMSASLEFLTGMFGWGHEGMCNLNDEGLRRYNVVNID